MLSGREVVEGPYLQDLLSQPAALDRACERLEDRADLQTIGERLRDGAFRQVVLTGMGSSLFALHPLHLELTARGFRCHMVETSELIHYQRALLADALLVVVSQSGRSAEIVSLTEVERGTSVMIGVTNDAESPLGKRADACLLMDAGVENSVSCKTYLTSLLLLDWLTAILFGDSLEERRGQLLTASKSVEQYISEWRSHVDCLLPVVDGVRHVFVTGRGRSLAAAQTGGLVLKESVRMCAEGMSSAAFRHGPFELLGPGVLVMIMAGDAPTFELNARLAADVRRLGGKAALVEPGATEPVFRLPDVADRVRPIVEILPVQMLTLALAGHRGIEAGRFERASKITDVE